MSNDFEKENEELKETITELEERLTELEEKNDELVDALGDIQNITKKYF